MFIGDVQIPIVSEIIAMKEAEVDEIAPLNSFGEVLDRIPVKHENLVENVTVLGFINKEAHHQNLSLEEQKQEIKSLRKNSREENNVDYKQYEGYFLVEDVNVLDDGDSRIVNEVEIEARYFPWPKYHPDERPEEVM